MDVYTYSETLLDLLIDNVDGVESKEQRQVLEEYVINPLLDDDMEALSLRIGSNCEVLAPKLDLMRERGVIRSVGRRGNALCFDFMDEVRDSKGSSTASVNENSSLQIREWSIQALLAAYPHPSAFFVGEMVYVNKSVHETFGISEEGIDVDCLIHRLGFDPRDEDLSVGKPKNVSIDMGYAVWVSRSFFGELEGVLVVVHSENYEWELVQANGQIQEDLFKQLRSEISGPAAFLKKFLFMSDKSDDLEAARSAIEKINNFLEMYMLSEKDNKNQYKL